MEPMPDTSLIAEMNDRSREVFRRVVEAYLQTGQPVGSKVLAADEELHCGPSTIRNELAMLEEHGLLAHPHTSAGRVPTDAGHRYYVDRLGEPTPLAGETRSTVAGAADSAQALEDTLRETLRALAKLTRGLAVAATRRDADLMVRTAIVSALGPNQALLVLALGNGHVENRMIECPADFEKRIEQRTTRKRVLA